MNGDALLTLLGLPATAPELVEALAAHGFSGRLDLDESGDGFADCTERGLQFDFEDGKLATIQVLRSDFGEALPRGLTWEGELAQVHQPEIRRYPTEGVPAYVLFDFDDVNIELNFDEGAFIAMCLHAKEDE